MLRRLLILLIVPSGMFAAEGPPLLVGGVGLFDAGDSNQGMLMLEYRFAHPYYHLHKIAGFNLTTDDSFYGYFGLGYDIGMTENYRLTPTFSVGYYAQGSGKDLGLPFQFRPSLEISRVYSNECRLGLQYAYLSNFGIGGSNPGAHCVALFFGFPLNLIL